jgi:hypothetical protein
VKFVNFVGAEGRPHSGADAVGRAVDGVVLTGVLLEKITKLLFLFVGVVAAK